MQVKGKTIGLIAAGATALAVLTATPASAAGTAKLSVVHGIPGVTVNICVDGTNTIPNFASGDIVKSVSVPAGSHTFKIVEQADSTCSTAGIQRPPASSTSREGGRISRPAWCAATWSLDQA